MEGPRGGSRLEDWTPEQRGGLSITDHTMSALKTKIALILSPGHIAAVFSGIALRLVEICSGRLEEMNEQPVKNERRPKISATL